MSDKKQNKVVAEITLAHVMRFAHEQLGQRLSHDDALLFFNEDGRAYEMWKHMMHAGEDYLRSELRCRIAGA